MISFSVVLVEEGSVGKEALEAKPHYCCIQLYLNFPKSFQAQRGTMPENVNLLRAFGVFFFWTAFNTALVDVVGSEQQIPLSV